MSEIRPSDIDPVELELETYKWLTIDSLAMSVASGQLERDKAVELLEVWFEPDQFALAALFRQISNLQRSQGESRR